MRFHEFTEGLVLRAGPRLVGKEEILAFARRYDAQPFHVDEEAANGLRWGGLISSGWMTCAIAMELVANNILLGSTSYGSPGMDELRWENPVRPGDELSLTATILGSRISSSGKVGVLRWQWEMHNQKSQRVLNLTCTSLFDLPDPPPVK